MWLITGGPALDLNSIMNHPQMAALFSSLRWQVLENFHPVFDDENANIFLENSGKSSKLPENDTLW